ncbi:hypothetical protein MRB53_040949 [Persea americana]|nr:hypothetical protein MRB53_040949 [Persea americana]
MIRQCDGLPTCMTASNHRRMRGRPTCEHSTRRRNRTRPSAIECAGLLVAKLMIDRQVHVSAYQKKRLETRCDRRGAVAKVACRSAVGRIRSTEFTSAAR